MPLDLHEHPEPRPIAFRIGITICRALLALSIGFALLMSSAAKVRADGDQGRLVSFTHPQMLSPNTNETDFIAVATHAIFGVAIRADHSLYAWGLTQPPPAGKDYVKVAAAFSTLIALHSDGTIEVWGGRRPLGAYRQKTFRKRLQKH